MNNDDGPRLNKIIYIYYKFATLTCWHKYH